MRAPRFFPSVLFGLVLLGFAACSDSPQQRGAEPSVEPGSRSPATEPGGSGQPTGGQGVSSGATQADLPNGDIDASDEPDAAVGRPVVLPDGREAWFVQFDEPIQPKGEALPRIRQAREQFYAASTLRGLDVKPVRTFESLWNGISVHVTKDELSAIKQIPGVKAVFPVVMIEREEPETPHVLDGDVSVLDLTSATVMTGADLVHSSLGFTGQGIRVGVIDSGIDYNHPDLGGCFGPGCRVAVGYDFVGDSFDGANGSSVPVPDSDPDDCGGHGTHVAGIIGASGTLTGVAPDVTFGAYRVFGCSGSTRSDIMIEAMERAFSDSMRIVNMSIGSVGQWPDYPTAKAATQLQAEGVIVTASAGNSGNISFVTGAPGNGDGVIAAASVDNASVVQPAFRVTPDNQAFGYVAASGAPAAPTSGTYPLARTGTVTTTNDACTTMAAGSLTGKTVLIRRGTCSFYIKAKNAQDAGAAQVIIYNNTTGFITPTVAGNPPVTIPVVAITQDQGAALNTRLDAGPVSLTWTAGTALTPNPTGGQVSSFSASGPSITLSFKPDLAAPGGSIWSTYPVELGSFSSQSGTSMAAPHVAGAAALMLQWRSSLSHDELMTRLQNTAVPAAWAGNPAGPVKEAVHRQGAGLIQIDDAILSTIHVTPSAIALGEVTAAIQKTITIDNQSAAATVYDLTVEQAEGASGSFFAPTNTATTTSVSFSTPSVLVPAFSQAPVDLTVTADAAAPNGTLFGAYVVLTPQGGGQVLRVPLMGYKGDYQAATVMTPTVYSLPAISTTSAASGKISSSGSLITIGSGPYMLVHVETGARKLRIEVLDGTATKLYGYFLNTEFVGRSSITSANTVDSYKWDGSITQDKETVMAPAGDYTLRIKVLKPLGDENNPAHWESWTSPMFYLVDPLLFRDSQHLCRSHGFAR